MIGSDETDSMAMTSVGDSLFNTWHEHNLPSRLDTIADALEHANIKYFIPHGSQIKKQGLCKVSLVPFCIEDGILSLIDFEMAAPLDSLAEQGLRIGYLPYGFYKKEESRQALHKCLDDPRQSWESELNAKLWTVKFDELRCNSRNMG